MRTSAAGSLLLLILSGCSFLSQQPDADPVRRLRRDIDASLLDSLFIPSLAAVKVISLESGEVLYDRNSSLLLRPASNMKLLTTAAALIQLGPSYTFRTTLATDAVTPPPLAGSVYLKGFGDPDLHTSDLDSLAGLLWDQGYRSIGGDIVADATWYDSVIWGEGWMWDDEPDPDGAAISGLSVNKNCVTVTVSPDTIAPGAIMLSQQPATSYVDIVSCARVTADSPGVPLSVNRLFRERSNTIVVRGDLRPDAPPASFRTTVWQPELYAARLFREACERRGMAVYGTERFGSTPSTFRAIGEIRRRFDSVIVNLNKQSDNLSAECTLKALGAAASGPPGTFSAGVSAVDRMLDAFGIDTTRYRLVDGSGVSHYNLISADLLIRVLAGMAHQRELFPIYYSSLPLAGRDGTLAHRMQHTPAEGNVHAKTGSLSGVSSLSGYARTQEGELLAFSIIMENFVAPTDRYRAVQDSIAVLLASFTRHPQFSRR